MAGNSRLTVAVHAICWLALAERQGRRALTSEEIAASLESNPVAVRRALGPLRDAGLVTTGMGPGGGWSLRRPAAEITVADVYAAVEPAALFALHPHEPRQTCPVGYGIRPVLEDIYADAARVLIERLSHHTIESVLETVLREHPLPCEAVPPSDTGATGRSLADDARSTALPWLGTEV